MALQVEGVVNCSVNAQEALGRSRRLEPLQLALASSDRLMRILRPIILPDPPKGSKISYGQMILVIADYLKKHPEQLHENFHMLAVLALNTAWPCVTER